MAELAVTEPNSNSLKTVTIAPHQVYGPNARLFLSKMMTVAGRDQLYIFGKGNSTISIAFVDDFAHGLLCAMDALEERSDVRSQPATAGNTLE